MKIGGRFLSKNYKAMFVWTVGTGLGVLFFFGIVAIPVKSWITQSSKKDQAKQQMASIESDISDLNSELDLLKTDAEIERRARRDFGYVYPGEESYRIIDK